MYEMESGFMPQILPTPSPPPPHKKINFSKPSGHAILLKVCYNVAKDKTRTMKVDFAPSSSSRITTTTIKVGIRINHCTR